MAQEEHYITFADKLIGTILHKTFEVEVGSLSVSKDHRFMQNGLYDKIDTLVWDLESKYSKHRNIKKVFAHAEKIAVPVIAGGLVGLISGLLTGDTENSKQLVIQGMEYGFCVSLPSHLLNMALTQWYLHDHSQSMVSLSHYSLHQDNSYGRKRKVSREYIALYSIPKARAQCTVLAALMSYENWSKVSKMEVICETLSYSIAYATIGLMSKLIPSVHISTGELAEIGGITGLGHGIIKKLRNKKMTNEVTTYMPEIVNLSIEDRSQLVGGLVQHWYPMPRPNLPVVSLF